MEAAGELPRREEPIGPNHLLTQAPRKRSKSGALREEAGCASAAFAEARVFRDRSTPPQSDAGFLVSIFSWCPPLGGKTDK